MAKGQALGHEGRPGANQGAQGAESESNEAEHPERIRSEGCATTATLGSDRSSTG